MSDGPKCVGCKRSLKRPSPTGYGPVCWRKLHGRPARQPRPTRPRAAGPGPGQPELPLAEQLEL